MESNIANDKKEKIEDIQTNDLVVENYNSLDDNKELLNLKQQLHKLLYVHKSSISNCVAEIRKLKKIIAVKNTEISLAKKNTKKNG